MASKTDLVTGSFSYSGQYITQLLLAAGRQVRTMTGHPQPGHPLAGQVATFPYDFEHPDHLLQVLRGIDTLYNTYWIRFPRSPLTYDVAVRNLEVLFRAAAQAGVRKIVHLSIINPFEDSPYAYFRGKARVERAIRKSGLAYTILRPTVVFGSEDILINNIAWMVRTFPIFLMPGAGDCLVQPIYVRDLASLAVEAGETAESGILDAAGPEIFTYRELVLAIARQVGRSIRLVGVPPYVVYLAGALIGRFLHDVVLTYEEVCALRDSILCSAQPPRGKVRFRDWLAVHGDQLGREYRSELRRHF